VTKRMYAIGTLECVTRDVWAEMSALLLDFLDAITLEDLIKKYNKRREGDQ